MLTHVLQFANNDSNKTFHDTMRMCPYHVRLSRKNVSLVVPHCIMACAMTALLLVTGLRASSLSCNTRVSAQANSQDKSWMHLRYYATTLRNPALRCRAAGRSNPVHAYLDGCDDLEIGFVADVQKLQKQIAGGFA